MILLNKKTQKKTCLGIAVIGIGAAYYNIKKKKKNKTDLKPEQLLLDTMISVIDRNLTYVEIQEFMDICTMYEKNTKRIPSLQDIVQIGQIFEYQWAKDAEYKVLELDDRPIQNLRDCYI